MQTRCLHGGLPAESRTRINAVGGHHSIHQTTGRNVVYCSIFCVYSQGLQGYFSVSTKFFVKIVAKRLIIAKFCGIFNKLYSACMCWCGGISRKDSSMAFASEACSAKGRRATRRFFCKYSTIYYAGVVEWQTRRTQNPMLVTTCGFKSHHQHQQSYRFTVALFYKSQDLLSTDSS